MLLLAPLLLALACPAFALTINEIEPNNSLTEAQNIDASILITLLEHFLLSFLRRSRRMLGRPCW